MEGGKMNLIDYSRIGVNTLYESVVLNGIKNVELDNIIDQLSEIYNAGDAGMFDRFPQFYAKIKQILNICVFAKCKYMETENDLAVIVEEISNLKDLAHHFFCEN